MLRNNQINNYQKDEQLGLFYPEFLDNITRENSDCESDTENIEYMVDSKQQYHFEVTIPLRLFDVQILWNKDHKKLVINEEQYMMTDTDLQLAKGWNKMLELFRIYIIYSEKNHSTYQKNVDCQIIFIKRNNEPYEDFEINPTEMLLFGLEKKCKIYTKDYLTIGKNNVKLSQFLEFPTIFFELTTEQSTSQSKKARFIYDKFHGDIDFDKFQNLEKEQYTLRSKSSKKQKEKENSENNLEQNQEQMQENESDTSILSKRYSKAKLFKSTLKQLGIEVQKQQKDYHFFVITLIYRKDLQHCRRYSNKSDNIIAKNQPSNFSIKKINGQNQTVNFKGYHSIKFVKVGLINIQEIKIQQQQQTIEEEKKEKELAIKEKDLVIKEIIEQQQLLDKKGKEMANKQKQLQQFQVIHTKKENEKLSLENNTKHLFKSQESHKKFLEGPFKRIEDEADQSMGKLIGQFGNQQNIQENIKKLEEDIDITKQSMLKLANSNQQQEKKGENIVSKNKINMMEEEEEEKNENKDYNSDQIEDKNTCTPNYEDLYAQLIEQTKNKTFDISNNIQAVILRSDERNLDDKKSDRSRSGSNRKYNTKCGKKKQSQKEKKGKKGKNKNQKKY